jgi:hypothetical protein
VVNIVCSFDTLCSEFIKPSYYFERASVKETFDNFLKLSVCVNTALLQILMKEKLNGKKVVPKKNENKVPPSASKYLPNKELEESKEGIVEESVIIVK